MSEEVKIELQQGGIPVGSATPEDLAAADQARAYLDGRPPTVEIGLTPTGTGTVLLDGTDVSKVVSGLTVKAKVGGLTEVTLSVPATRGVKFSGEARIEIEPELRAIMLAAGWEPPGVWPVPGRDDREDEDADPDSGRTDDSGRHECES